ncbi:MAG: PilZ domain-containing protein [Candidatus Omnitrophica bacterium]|nr:PilZ domain-containing protein [Candidatus Omnitrophota bacterium]
MEQKRVYKRIEDLIEVEFVPADSGAEAVIRTKTRDISAGGIKVFLNKRLTLNEQLPLKITLPGEKKTVEMQAEVIDSYLIGVVGDSGQEMLYETRFKFVGLDPETKNIITRYVHQCRNATIDARLKK